MIVGVDRRFGQLSRRAFGVHHLFLPAGPTLSFAGISVLMDEGDLKDVKPPRPCSFGSITFPESVRDWLDITYHTNRAVLADVTADLATPLIYYNSTMPCKPNKAGFFPNSLTIPSVTPPKFEGN
jgi:hypothetical protein